MRCRQFHNQPADSPLHRWLKELWSAVAVETAGRLEVEVCPENAGIPGGDPQALEMLVAGEVDFYTVMGGLLGRLAPVCEITGLPFAFRTPSQAFEALDGGLGEFLGEELRARGLYAVPRACFENGFRHITTRARPIRDAEDLAGLRIRVPAGRMFAEFFETLGARPTAINLNRLYAALLDGVIDGQENPLVMVEVNRLYEIQTHVSLTGHMWSGFTLVANLARWESLPATVRDVAADVAARYAAGQRAETEVENAALVDRLGERGMIVNHADTAGMRRLLGDFYARWKRELGPKAWSLLETSTGPLG